MYDFCTICMVKRIALVELSCERRRLFDTLVSPYINLDSLKNLRMLLCLDCNMVLVSMLNFQHTMLKGVKNLIALNDWFNSTYHDLPGFIKCQTDGVLPTLCKETGNESDIFYMEQPVKKKPKTDAEDFPHYTKDMINSLPKLITLDPSNLIILAENGINLIDAQVDQNGHLSTVENQTSVTEENQRLPGTVLSASLSLDKESKEDGHGVTGSSLNCGCPEDLSDSSETLSCSSGCPSDAAPGGRRSVARPWMHDHNYAYKCKMSAAGTVKNAKRKQALTKRNESREVKKTKLNRQLYEAIKLALESRTISEDFDITQYEPESFESAPPSPERRLESPGRHSESLGRRSESPGRRSESPGHRSESTLSCQSDYEDAENFPNIVFAKAFNGVTDDTTLSGASNLHVVTNPPSEWPCAGERCRLKLGEDSDQSDAASDGGAEEHADSSRSECRAETELDDLNRQLRRKASEPESPLSCAACGLSFRHQARLLDHLITARHRARTQWRFQCDICKRKFKDKKRIAEHIGRGHFSEEATKCPMCAAMFRSARALLRHAAAHVLDARAHLPRANVRTRRRRGDSTPASAATSDEIATDRVQKRKQQLTQKPKNTRQRTQISVNSRKQMQNPGNYRQRIQNPGTPRKRKRTQNPGPQRKRPQNQSPLRTRTQNPSPLRKRTQNPSPPRKRTQNPSPPRKRTQNSSPPRKRIQNSGTPRKRTQNPGPQRKRIQNPATPRKRTQNPGTPRKRTQNPGNQREPLYGVVRRRTLQTENEDARMTLNRSEPRKTYGGVPRKQYGTLPRRTENGGVPLDTQYTGQAANACKTRVKSVNNKQLTVDWCTWSRAAGVKFLYSI